MAARCVETLHVTSVRWPFLLGLVGLPFALCGMFGYFFVTGPPTVKLIIGAALAYAAVRFTWAWWRA